MTIKTQGSKIEIRSFEWVDIERYLERIVEMQLENTYKFHYPEKTQNRDYIKKKIMDIKKFLDNGNTYFIGAKSDDELYGFIWCYGSEFIDEKRLNINSLFVCKEARGISLGRLLMDEVKRIALENDYNSLGTNYASFNTAAGEFYSKNEFITTRIEMVCKLK